MVSRAQAARCRNRFGEYHDNESEEPREKVTPGSGTKQSYGARLRQGTGYVANEKKSPREIGETLSSILTHGIMENKV